MYECMEYATMCGTGTKIESKRDGGKKREEQKKWTRK